LQWKDLHAVLRTNFPALGENVEDESAEEFPMKMLAFEALRCGTEHSDDLQGPLRTCGGLEELCIRVRACCAALEKEVQK